MNHSLYSPEELGAMKSAGITPDQVALIDDKLSNAEESPDSELAELFAGAGISQDRIEEALNLRAEVMINPFSRIIVRDGALLVDRIPVLKTKPGED